MIAREQITGLVLAGGASRRMGGIDKGLVAWRGRALAAHAIERLGPQVGTVAVSANRHVERYAELPGVAAGAVWADRPLGGAEALAGPLAGLATGLARATTPYVVCVPCDAPHFPVDLVARLVRALEAESAVAAIACTAHGEVWKPEPVFCLAHCTLADSLQAFLAGGGRRAGEWARQVGAARAHFADTGAFANLNTPAELAAARETGCAEGDAASADD